MSKFLTLYGVYFVNEERNRGYSSFYDTEGEADYQLHQMAADWHGRVVKQTYEIDDDGHHDCGDDE